MTANKKSLLKTEYIDDLLNRVAIQPREIFCMSSTAATNTNIDPNVVVNTALVEKLDRLEREVLELRSQLGKARDHSIKSLGFLRLHQAIILFTGEDLEKFNNSIASELGGEYLHNLHRHMFCLSDAPLDKKLIETFRASLKGCNVKW